MAFRGGRGRGRGFGHQHAKQEPFILFPEIELPSIREVTNEEENLVIWNSRLQNYWKKSPFYFVETDKNMSQNVDIERYSDRQKLKAKLAHASFLQYLELNLSNFPREILPDSKIDRSKRRRTVQWNPDTDLAKLDLFEKLEQKHQGQEEKDDKEKKEGEDEEEDLEVDDDDGEYSDDADYNQNIDFDDDEDDFNMPDDNDDEGIY
ncbi:hypothetical protein MLD38_018016 [Melastoma candidum]|uniref:Uncharacterized protein n=1 Tax=Melastoma candidum TaxID=119954 RepID=A0ACB9QVM5_9MYRT|nr:hypothetical protein MLD38_018016 [Melastoma candidum]